ncbi:transmembrane anchor protein [Allopusillimonas ginsengisoli]|uniref:transmembrane anchor protein n=1 Tax=Allopusillimonas ginsengisoli TaxID=453575 RepID=UPI0039C0BBCF
MYNTDLPRRAELPTSEQLKRSTIIAAISALIILVTVVLPSEYAIDPTRIGRVLGLTEMGEIKTQLAAEAAADAAADVATRNVAQQPSASQPQQSIQANNVTVSDSTLSEIPITQQPPQPPTSVAQSSATPGQTLATPTPAKTGKSDELSITLKPGQGAEVKLVMTAGAAANFSWTANGAVVNYDTHGDGGGRSVSYEKGRGVANDEGVLEAAFDGNHGWFWRNRTEADVTVTLRTSGDYAEVKRVI